MQGSPDNTPAPPYDPAGEEPAPLTSSAPRMGRPLIVAITVACLGLALTAFGVQRELSRAHKADLEHFDRLSERLINELTRRVMVYNYGLMGSRSLFPASNSVERDEFRAMVSSRILPTEFPGALGIGYIDRIPDTDEAVAAYVAAARADGAPDFNVTVPPGAAPLPGSATDDRYIITFIEPVENNRPAVGLEIGAHPVRREAADRAMLTGEGSITGRIELVQDDQKVAGFLILLPVYHKQMPTETPEERIAATRGWVYMPIIAPPVFDGATQVADLELDVEVFDGPEPNTTNIIYDEDSHLATLAAGTVGPEHYTGRRFHQNRTLEIGGRTWTVSIGDSDQFIAHPRTGAWLIAGAGTLLSLLLGCLIFTLGSAARRARAIAQGMTTDLRHYADAAGQATRAKSAFLANMSHEIRTPMTSILGYTDLLREDHQAQVSQSKRLEYIDTIQRNGKHLLTVLNDILDISKIEAGKLDIEHVDVQPERIAHEVVSLMAVKAAEKQIAIDVVRATDIPETIQSDPVRLRQILVNLVGNAIKFTDVGGVKIAMSYDPDQQQLACTVADTGIGIADDQMGRLFNAFEQADASTTRQYGGSGLGLQISQRLAQILGGRITVQSTPGVGSQFTLTTPTGPTAGVRMLPAGTSTVVRDQAAPTTAEPSEDLPLGGVHILLAEDGPDNQRLICFHLKNAGATTTVVENGALAVRALTTDGELDGPLNPDTPFDLLLTDMQMPEMDGYTAVRTLRDKGATLPIVALTAHAMAGDEDRCRAAGCDAYASKPIDRAALVQVIREAINNGPGNKRNTREQAA